MINSTRNTLKVNVFSLLTLLMSIGIGHAQNIITVNNNPGAQSTYQDLQLAIDDANANDILHIQPSVTNYGNITIAKPLTLIGRSHNEPGKTSNIGTVIIQSSDVTLKGMVINSISFSSGTQPLPINNTRVQDCQTGSINLGITRDLATRITDTEITGCLITGRMELYADSENTVLANNIFASNAPLTVASTRNVAIYNNMFRSTANPSLTNNSTGDPLTLTNNIFITNRSDTDFSFNGVGITVLANNLTYNYGSGNFGFIGSFTDSATLYNTDPLFVDVDPGDRNTLAGTSTYMVANRLEDNFELAPGSSALTGGVGGSQMGVFGNGFLFNKFGNPRGVPLFDIVNFQGTVTVGSPIEVTISAIAN